MGLNRYAKRKDGNQEAIVKALRRAGVKVWILDTPCDLLTFHLNLFQPLEVKSKGGKLTPNQKKFVEETGCPVVECPEEALRALGVI